MLSVLEFLHMNKTGSIFMSSNCCVLLLLLEMLSCRLCSVIFSCIHNLHERNFWYKIKSIEPKSFRFCAVINLLASS